MEKIFWVRDDELDEVNAWLQKGGKVKMIVAAPGSEDSLGSSYAYIVIVFD